MKLDGRIEIAAPAADVWAFINDPERLASCVPGVRDVQAVDDRTFRGSISAAVGPMQSDFDFTSVITRSAFPTDLEVEMSGVDSMTKSQLTANVTATLESPEAARTLLVYRATVNVKGRLAILGEMILRATAGAMIGEVAKRMRASLESAP
jgi:carbon monoxide dehydrogenase subunit G